MSYERFPYSSYDQEHLHKSSCYSKPHSGRQTTFENVLLLCSAVKAKQTISEQRLAGQRTTSMQEIQSIKVNAKRQYQESELDQQKKKKPHW